MKFFKSLGHFFLSSLFASSVLTLSINVLAEEALNKVDAEALENTVNFMKNPAERNKYIEENPDAKKADQSMKQILGDGAESEEAYAAAAAIFRQLATDSNGDFSEMMQKIGDAQKDPQSFYKSLSPEHKALIKGLAEKAEAKKQQQNPQAN